MAGSIPIVDYSICLLKCSKKIKYLPHLLRPPLLLLPPFSALYWESGYLLFKAHEVRTSTMFLDNENWVIQVWSLVLCFSLMFHTFLTQGQVVSTATLSSNLECTFPPLQLQMTTSPWSTVLKSLIPQFCQKKVLNSSIHRYNFYVCLVKSSYDEPYKL